VPRAFDVPLIRDLAVTQAAVIPGDDDLALMWRSVIRTSRSSLSREGEPFTYNGFQNYVRRIGDRFKAAGVEHWMAHRCRHYWATSNHRNGMTIFDIAAEGGWKDSEMGRRYTDDRPFEELQAMPTALTAMLRRRAS
jgi:integrase